MNEPTQEILDQIKNDFEAHREFDCYMQSQEDSRRHEEEPFMLDDCSKMAHSDLDYGLI